MIRLEEHYRDVLFYNAKYVLSSYLHRHRVLPLVDVYFMKYEFINFLLLKDSFNKKFEVYFVGQS